VKSIIALVLLTLTSASLTFTAAILYSPVTKDFAIENQQWNGLSDFISLLARDDFSVLICKDQLLLPSAPLSETCILIMGPELPYSSDEVELLLNFIESGGTLILLDDFGSGNELLKKLGIPVRLVGKPLLDEVVYSKRPNFPVIVGLTGDVRASNVTIIMNVPTTLEVLNTSANKWTVTIIASSSEYSFIDYNLNGKLDGNETKRPYPVIAIARRGRGRAIIVSDSSILINCMIDEGNNYYFLKLLLSTYGVKTVVLDYSHYEKKLAELLKERIVSYFKEAEVVLRDPLFSYALTIFIVATILITVHSVAKRCKREHI